MLLRLLLYEFCEAYRIVWARVDINSLRTLFVRPVRFGDGAAFYGRNREPFIPITRAEKRAEQGRPILARLRGRRHRILPLHNGRRVIESSPVRVISAVRPSVAVVILSFEEFMLIGNRGSRGTSHLPCSRRDGAALVLKRKEESPPSFKRGETS